MSYALGSVFRFPRPDNAFSHQPSDFVNSALAEVAALEGPLGPVQAGACFGLYAQGAPLEVFGNTFEQTQQPLTSYYYAVAYPQTGLYARPGQALVRDNAFEQLYQGYVAPAEQADGVIVGNLFRGCQRGLRFQRLDTSQPVGTAVVDCNTFERPISARGESFAILRAPGHYTGTSSTTDQIDFSHGITLPGNIPTLHLMRNQFLGSVDNPNSTQYNANDVQGNIYWHIYNDASNDPIGYERYLDNLASPNPSPDDAQNNHVGPVDYSNGNNIQLVIAITSNNAVRSPADNTTCASDLSYPTNYGLQRPTALAQTIPQPTGLYLAQNTPNPCSGSTTIRYRTLPGQSGQLVLRDAISGRIRLQQTLASGEHQLTLDISRLPAGLYVYSLEVNGRAVTHRKLLVQ